MEIRRPMLKPGLRRVWRGPQTLQLGLDVPCPVLLHPVDDAVEAVLGLLDGHVAMSELEGAAGAAGVPADELRDLVRRLAAAGLLADAAVPDPDLAALPRALRDGLAAELAAAALHDRRPDASVRALRTRRELAVTLLGGDLLGRLLADRLRAAGVGSVDVVDTDVVPRDPQQPPGRVRPLLVVPAAVARARRRELVTSSWPHLVTEVGETLVRLGPLVVPGRSACFGCLEQRRLDRDPGWGPVSAQLAGRPPAGGSTTLLQAAVCLATLHLVDWAAGGRPPELDGVVEVGLPHGQVVRRDCPPHPACGCTWPSGARDVTMAG